MINIQKMIEQANQNGYQGGNASAKVCQDIVLKALATGSLSRNATINVAYDDEGASLLINSDEQMLKDIETCKDNIDFVLVFKLSRFGRNAADVLCSPAKNAGLWSESYMCRRRD